ncbi:MlaD family protein [Nocardia sp. NPDC051030]|uniref:MlaD family protein n=1 Tax=Nocardia sp. NPDC051030 TaxID=3155162 RepID=UPI00341454B4
MQALIDRVRRRGGVDRSEAAAARRELRYGAAGALAVVVMLAIAGVMYVLPLGKQTYTAEVTEAGSIKTGDSVRVAGIPVGEIRSVRLESDRVRVRFTVDDSVFVGDQTTLEVRMLTVAGGHYVAVLPAGANPLGEHVIPPDRVKLPYSLIRAFQDAAAPVEQVNGDTLRQNFQALDAAITDGPDAIRRVGDAVTTLNALLIQQRADISRTVQVADEYSQLLGRLTPRMIGLFQALKGIVDAGWDKRDQLEFVLKAVAGILDRLEGVHGVYDNRLREYADQLAAAVPDLQQLMARLDQSLTNLRDFGTKVQQFISPQAGAGTDQSAVTIQVPDLCVPLPGQGC